MGFENGNSTPIPDVKSLPHEKVGLFTLGGVNRNDTHLKNEIQRNRNAINKTKEELHEMKGDMAVMKDLHYGALRRQILNGIESKAKKGTLEYRLKFIDSMTFINLLKGTHDEKLDVNSDYMPYSEFIDGFLKDLISDAETAEKISQRYPGKGDGSAIELLSYFNMIINTKGREAYITEDEIETKKNLETYDAVHRAFTPRVTQLLGLHYSRLIGEKTGDYEAFNKAVERFQDKNFQNTIENAIVYFYDSDFAKEYYNLPANEKMNYSKNPMPHEAYINQMTGQQIHEAILNAEHFLKLYVKSQNPELFFPNNVAKDVSKYFAKVNDVFKDISLVLMGEGISVDKKTYNQIESLIAILIQIYTETPQAYKDYLKKHPQEARDRLTFKRRLSLGYLGKKLTASNEAKIDNTLIQIRKQLTAGRITKKNNNGI